MRCLVLQYEAFSLRYLPEHRKETLAIVAVTSVIALAYNVVHSLMIQQTSAVTTTVLGEAKIVGLMFLSYILLGELQFPCFVTEYWTCALMALHYFVRLGHVYACVCMFGRGLEGREVGEGGERRAGREEEGGGRKVGRT
jgi:hypothetical protein